MKEIFEFRVQNKYVHLLIRFGNEKRNSSNTTFYVTKDDPMFEQIRHLTKDIRERENDFFFLYSNIKREYSKNELDSATLFQLKIKKTFEPSGEECGTSYNESSACEICGANRKQNSPLRLEINSIPKSDISRTIGGEIVVSEKFVISANKWKIKGLEFKPIEFANGTSQYLQLTIPNNLDLSASTVAGVNIFDLSATSGLEIYKCPKGHTIGLNLLSEAYVRKSQLINDFDCWSSKQKIGVKRGLLRPEPLYLCSSSFIKMIQDEKLTGFEFEVAHIQ